jgi:hypothetical protein
VFHLLFKNPAAVLRCSEDASFYYIPVETLNIFYICDFANLGCSACACSISEDGYFIEENL